MSGIAAVFNRDRRPVDRAVLGRVSSAIAHRGPDGEGRWIDGPIGLGHQMLHTTPESRLERQPAVSERGSHRLVYDGRLDNADDVRSAIRGNGRRVTDPTDAALILLAYDLWGDECPGHLIGDFAFVLWDGDRRECFCARDALGLKAFYYYLDDRLFVCGSELRQILAHPDVACGPHEGVIGEYLAGAVTSVDETLFHDVRRLPAAHCLRVAAGRATRRRYWDIDPERRVRFATDAAYAESFLTLFKDVVAAHGRAVETLGTELSGGFDSSSVTAVACDLAHGGRIMRPVEAFSLRFPGRPCDEPEYIAELLRTRPVPAHAVNAASLQPRGFSTTIADDREFPDFPNAAAWYPLMNAMRMRGCRVVLTGAGGDEWFTGSYFHYADLLRRLRIPALLKQMTHDRAIARDGETAAVRFPSMALWRAGIVPLIPLWARKIARTVLPRRSVPRWIDERFAASIGLPDRLRQRRPRERRWQSHAQQDIHSGLTNGWFYQGNETADRVHAKYQLEKRSPFLDRRIVEFALGLPEEQRWRGGDTKFVVRGAMKGVLPEQIRQRQTKANFGMLFTDVVTALADRQAFGSLTIGTLGWVDQRRVDDMASSARDHAWPLWLIFGVETWFNEVFVNRGQPGAFEEELWTKTRV